MKTWGLKVSSDCIFLQCLRDCDSQPALPLSHYGCVFYRRGGVGYCRPQTHRQPDWFSPLDLCGISHSGELAGTAGSLRHCWKRESQEWAGFFFSFLVLWPLRFPPVLTWLRLYNSPERVTSSRVEIPGPFFFFLFRPISFFSFTGRVGRGGGAQLLWNICQAASCRGRANRWFMATSGRCKALVYAFNHAKSPGWIGDWKEMVWWGFMESMLGFTLMATGVNILYDRGISAAQCFQAEVSLSWCLHQANAVSAIQYGQKIIVKL